MTRAVRTLAGAVCGLAILALAAPAAGAAQGAHAGRVAAGRPDAGRPAGGDGGSSGGSRPAAVRQPAGVVEHWGAFFGDNRLADEDVTVSPVPVALPGPVTQIGTSNSTQYALLADGSLYAWGQGTNGQLGNGASSNSFAAAVRVRFPAGVKIASIPADAMPYDTAFAVDTDGHVWGWGLNAGGELCLGNNAAHLAPAELPFSGVTTLAGANDHASYDSGGTVYSCGQNLEGALGDGSTRSSYVPVPVAGLPSSPVTALVASFANAGALLADGEYLDWGYDGAGQLGNGTVGQASDVPVRVSLPFPVTQVAQGGSLWANGQTLVMTSGGLLWAWGNGGHYQLGTGTTAMQPSPVPFYPPPGVTYRALATGGLTSYAVSTAGDVYAWGGNTRGQVGDGSTAAAEHPVLVEHGAAQISATANDVAVSAGR
jgi:alpha-tubulin suppressor-like RCC1 family protein